MLKFLSYNARGLRQTKKRRRLFAYLHRCKADVILIQESHCSHMDEKYWCNEWGSNILFAHGSNASRGVCILFNPKLHFTVLKHTSHVDGRFVMVDIQFHDHIITIVGVYGPNIDSPSFFVKLFRELSSFQGDTIIMAGDFNFVFNLKLDKVGGQFKTNFKARDECIILSTSGVKKPLF